MSQHEAWNAAWRQRALPQLAAQPWDLIVIGGGISGAGILREAARRGWRCLLLEQRDPAITLVAVGLGAGHFVQSRSAGPAAIAGKAQPQPIKIEQLAAEADLPAPSALPAASLPTDAKPAATAPATPVAPASTASACPEQLELMAKEAAAADVAAGCCWCCLGRP